MNLNFHNSTLAGKMASHITQEPIVDATLASTFLHRMARAAAAWGCEFATWQRQRRDQLQLRAMSDDELRDLGIGRSQIPHVVVDYVTGDIGGLAAHQP